MNALLTPARHGEVFAEKAPAPPQLRQNSLFGYLGREVLHNPMSAPVFFSSAQWTFFFFFDSQ